MESHVDAFFGGPMVDGLPLVAQVDGAFMYDLCIDLCTDLCTDLCIDLCTDLCTELAQNYQVHHQQIAPESGRE